MNLLWCMSVVQLGCPVNHPVLPMHCNQENCSAYDQAHTSCINVQVAHIDDLGCEGSHVCTQADRASIVAHGHHQWGLRPNIHKIPQNGTMLCQNTMRITCMHATCLVKAAVCM